MPLALIIGVLASTYDKTRQDKILKLCRAYLTDFRRMRHGTEVTDITCVRCRVTLRHKKATPRDRHKRPVPERIANGASK